MSDNGADYLNELAGRPGARAPASIGEIAGAEWKRAGLDTFFGLQRPLADSVDELEGAIASASGKSVQDYARDVGFNLGATATIDQRIRMLGDLADTLPEEQRQKIEPLKDARRRAADKAQAIERDANEIAGATYGLTGNATAFLVGTARQLLDPAVLGANVLTGPLGGPFKGSLLKVLGRQFAAGAAGQALVEPAIEGKRAELGLEAGPGRAAANILESGLGSAGLAGIFRAAGFIARQTFRALPRSPGPPPMGDWDGNRTFTGYMSGEDAAAFDYGHTWADGPPVAMGEGGSHPPGFTGGFDLSDISDAVPTRTRMPDPAIPPSDLNLSPLSPEDVRGLDRGEIYPDRPPAAIGEAGELPRFAGEPDFSGVREAVPTRTRTQEPPPPGPSDLSLSPLTADDVAALDRGGHTAPVEHVEPIGAGAGGGFDLDLAAALRQLAPEDFEAAAHVAEREQIVHGDRPAVSAAEHAERLADTTAKMEEGRPIEPPETVVHVGQRKGPAANRDQSTFSLFEFLAAAGGLHPEDMRGRGVGGDKLATAIPGGGFVGELQFLREARPFVPGFGPLLRKTGLSIAQASERARLAGYAISEDNATGDFLELLRQEGSGERQYQFGYERPPSAGELADMRAREREMIAERSAEVAPVLDAALAEHGIAKATKADKKRAIEILAREGETNALAAYERALLERTDREEARRAARQKATEHVPGWDVDDATAAPRDRGGAAQAEERPGGGEPGGSARGTGDGDGPAPAALGDPELAREAERALTQNPDLLVPDKDGNMVPASEALARAQEDIKAAQELIDCVGKPPGEEPPF